MKVRCEICQELIGVIDPLLIAYPYTGKDFQSVDPAHGVPPPFHASLDWEFMRCPYGNHRPWTLPDRLLLETGEYLELSGRDTPPSPAAAEGEAAPLPGGSAPSAFICRECGKDCTNKAGLTVHMIRKHKEDR